MLIQIKGMEGGYVVECLDPEGEPIIKRRACPSMDAVIETVKEYLADMPANFVDALLDNTQEKEVS